MKARICFVNTLKSLKFSANFLQENIALKVLRSEIRTYSEMLYNHLNDIRKLETMRESSKIILKYLLL